MYCTTCGKQIINTARFCNFCGAPVQFAAPTTGAAPAPVKPENPVIPPYNEPTTQPESAAAPSYSETAAQPESAAAPSYGEAAAQPESAAVPSYGEAAAQPESAAAPSYGEAAQPPQTISGDNAVGTFSIPSQGQIPINGEGDVHIVQVPEKPAKALPERKYTLGHIMLCLGAVAIMAIVAGVFAGLYFSVV